MLSACGKKQNTGDDIITDNETTIETEDISTDDEAISYATQRPFDVEYGLSDLYTQADMDSAIDKIIEEFDTWDGCVMYDIKYAGDECNTEDNIAWMNQLGDDYTQCIEFISDFHSPVEAYGAWEADTDYNDYQWWLARTDNGEWNLMTWGYN